MEGRQFGLGGVDMMAVRKLDVPYGAWVVDGYLDFLSWALHESVSILPHATADCWIHYHNDHERKRAMRDVSLMPRDIRKALAHLISPTFLEFVRDELGFATPVTADTSMHGAGLHVSDPGGFLAPHLDYSAHPLIPGMMRRLNVLLFLGPQWDESWGGAFCLHDDMGEKVVERVYPSPGRLVVWECDELAYHGAEKVTGPESRHTLAVYYLCPATPTAVRKRALFVPARD